MRNDPYSLMRPERLTSSVVFASPHSGRDYGEEFLASSVLDELRLRSSEDAFVDMLFDHAPNAGAPFLVSHAPRAYVDLNRGADELDPALVAGIRNPVLNARVSSGLGVIPRVVAGGRAIYSGKITMSEAQRRLNRCWFPYHAQLKTTLDESLENFGEAILIDCHSMPNEAVANVPEQGPRPEIVLGDRHGASARPEVVMAVADAFRSQGFVVAHNSPFSGAYITQQYGRPGRGQSVIQVEMDRSLYMDEAMVRPNAQFDDIRARLRSVIEEIADIGRTRQSLAAE